MRYFGYVFPILLVTVSETLCSAQLSENDILQTKEKIAENELVENCKTDTEKVKHEIFEALKGKSENDFDVNCNKYKEIFQRCKAILYALDEKTDPAVDYEKLCANDNKMKNFMRENFLETQKDVDSKGTQVSCIRFSLLTSALVVFF